MRHLIHNPHVARWGPPLVGILAAIWLILDHRSLLASALPLALLLVALALIRVR